MFHQNHVPAKEKRVFMNVEKNRQNIEKTAEHLTEKLTVDISEEELFDLADLFKVFADSTRIRILYTLFCGEKNVTEICEALDMTQSAVSHQLKILKTSHLAASRREGKTVVYRLADDHVKTIIAMGKEHIEEE